MRELNEYSHLVVCGASDNATDSSIDTENKVNQAAWITAGSIVGLITMQILVIWNFMRREDRLL